MSSTIALIIIMLVCCNVHKAEVISWPGNTCPFGIPEDTTKENLHNFAASGSPSGYTILSQNGTGRFSIAPNGTLSSAKNLDFESDEKAYSLEIMAFNNTGTPQNVNLTCVISVINVNDERPEFDKQSYLVNFPNDVAKDTTLLSVSATDGDETDSFNTVVYSIKAGSDNTNFTIDINTGVIGAVFNLTGPKTFVINVVATDSAKANFTDEASVSMCIRCTSGSSSLEINVVAFIALVLGVVLM